MEVLARGGSVLVRSPARLSRATACSCARRTRVRTGQRTRATATFPSGAALRVSRAACIMQRRARGCAALHCAPRLASVLLAIRSAVSCCHARECKGAPREAVARAKAFRKTPSRCGSRALISLQRSAALHVSRAACCIAERTRMRSASLCASLACDSIRCAVSCCHAR